MTDSTKRALRTIVQVLLGLAAAIAIAVPLIGAEFAPAAELGAIALAIAGTVTKVYNALEDAHILPAWLKGTTNTVEPPPEAGK